MSEDLQLTTYNIFSSITLSSVLKGSILAFIGTFLAPLWGFILLIIFLLIGDLFTGTLAAKRRGEVVESIKIARTVYKFGVYIFVLLGSAGAEEVFGGGVEFISTYQPISWTVAGVMCYRELKSMFENAESYTGAPFTDKLGLFERLFNSKSKKDVNRK